METTADILIIGGGPRRTVLPAYLGQYGIKNIVLEKELEITTDPRGIVLDEDGIRILQGTGLYDRIWTEVGTRKYLLRMPRSVFGDFDKASRLAFQQWAKPILFMRQKGGMICMQSRF